MAMWDVLRDVLRDVISDWRKVLRAFVFIVLVIGVFVFGAWIFTKLLHLQTKELRLGTGGYVLLTKQEGENAISLVLVYPQDWENSGIRVKKGDSLAFQADGRVNIDVAGLVQKVGEREAAEKKLLARARKRNKDFDIGHFLPERLFKYDDQDKNFRPARAWADPDGYEGAEDTAWPARTCNKILPEAHYATLIFAIRPPNSGPPTRTQSETPCPPIPSSQRWSDPLYAIGKGGGKQFVADKDGDIWFIVNDVWDGDDKYYPDKFYVDNMGAFFVNVTVSPQSR
jgi:hypothetical protein